MGGSSKLVLFTPLKAMKLNNVHDELTEIDIQTIAMALSCTNVGWTFSNILALNH